MKGKKAVIGISAGAVLCVIVAVVVVLILQNRKESYRQVKVYEVEGEASVTRKGIDDLQPYANMQLQSGDLVKVDTGRMTLKLDEDKYVYAEEKTEFSLEAEGDSKDSRTRIRLNRGAITNEIQNKLSTNSSYEVNTPNSTMAVRGTIFRVAVTYGEDGTCYTMITVFDGTVAVRLVYADGQIAEDEVLVGKNQEVVIYQNESETDYLGAPYSIDYTTLPKSCIESLKRAGVTIPNLKQTTEDASEEQTSEADTKNKTEAVTEQNSEVETENKTETTGQKSETTTENKTEETEIICTVTFLYNGEVFGTQKVKKGERAEKPFLQPSSDGSWDYNFSELIETDTMISWK